MTQIYHEPIVFEHKGKKIRGKKVFGTNFPQSILDIDCELQVLKDNFPRNHDKCLEIFEFLYTRYYQDYIWNSYEELYIRKSMELACDFMDLREGSDNQFMTLQGPTNVGKTYRLTAFYNFLYLMNPTKTAITLTSTTTDSTMARIWADYLDRFEEVKKHYPEKYNDKHWKITNSSQKMGLRYYKSNNKCVVKARSLNADVAEKKVIDNIIGTHGVNYWLGVDEATSCSTALLGARNNLAKNIICQCQLSGNPDEPNNLLGHAAKPVDGYEGHDYDNNDWYRNSYGIHLYFNPNRSPADLDPDPEKRRRLIKVKYPTMAQVLAEKEQYGEESDDYYRFTLGRIRLGEKDEGILSAKIIEKYQCTKNIEFAPNAFITQVIGFDPSLGNANSDQSIVYKLRIGLSVDGYVKTCFGGQTLSQVMHAIKQDKNSPETPLYQMIHAAKKIAEREKIPGSLVGMDSKPLGGGEIALRQWSKDITVIDGGSSASNRIVRKEKRACDLYGNKITECYAMFKLYCEAGLIGGIPESVLQYFYSRKFIKQEGDRKISIESKEDFLERTRSKSPDVPDAMVYGFMVAVVKLHLVLESVRSQHVNQKIADRRLAVINTEPPRSMPKPFKVAQIRTSNFSTRRMERWNK